MYLSVTLKNSNSDAGRSSDLRQFKTSTLHVIACLNLVQKIVILFPKGKGIVFFCVVLGVVAKLPNSIFKWNKTNKRVNLVP